MRLVGLAVALCAASCTSRSAFFVDADARGELADIPHGGTRLLTESFDDPDLAGRGWYDGPAGIISPVAVAGGGSFECDYASGATGCTAGVPGRITFAATDTVYMSLYVRFDARWPADFPGVGTFNAINDLDDPYVGPFSSSLTALTELEARPEMILVDTLNVDPNCVLLDDGGFLGCNGNYSTYPFTEARSVCACNGLLGDVDRHQCEMSGPDWQSIRFWGAPALRDDGRPWMEINRWHFLESFLRMNSVTNGIGIPDGQFRVWLDGELAAGSDHVLMRTGAHPTLHFNQLLLVFYMDSAPTPARTLWADELVIRTLPP